MFRRFNFFVLFLALAKPTLQTNKEVQNESLVEQIYGQDGRQLNFDLNLTSADVDVFIDFDDSPSEISFVIKDLSGTVVFFRPPNFYTASQDNVTERDITLVSGRDYTFNIKDQAGNGMMNPSGSYSVTQNGQVLVSGDGNFAALRETNFTVQMPPTISPAPTITPVPTSTPSPTMAPASTTDRPTVTLVPSDAPSLFPSTIPSDLPSMIPSDLPSDLPSTAPSSSQSFGPTVLTSTSDTSSLAPTEMIDENLSLPISEVEVVVFIDFDDNPEEIRWYIEEFPAFELVAASNVPYPSTLDMTSETVSLLPGKNYYFTIEDVAGNGMTNPSGSFTVTQDGIELLSGNGDFETFDIYDFTTFA